MKTYRILLLVTVFFGIVACKNETKTEPEIKTVDTAKTTKTYPSEEITTDFKDEKLKEVFVQYVGLKTAFVNTDATKASEEATKVITAFTDAGVEGEAIEAAQKIVESTDIESQRAAFVIVTKEVEKLLEGAVAAGTIYKQYCPMAFNNNGAYWLSESKEIRNPYFGDKMLKCGRIDSELK